MDSEGTGVVQPLYEEAGRAEAATLDDDDEESSEDDDYNSACTLTGRLLHFSFYFYFYPTLYCVD